MMTIKEFADRFVRLPDQTRHNKLARMQLHTKQSALFDAIDTLGPDGSRQHREFVISWIKKAGKSSSLAVIALYSMIADESNGPDREVIIASSDLAQSKDVTFATAKRIVQRDPWLSQTCRVLATEIVYSTQIRNERTGGVYTDESVLRAVARDVRGLHGSNASCTIIDEYWSQDTYDLAEALAQSPARPNPITVVASYVGLISQQKEVLPGMAWAARAGCAGHSAGERPARRPCAENGGDVEPPDAGHETLRNDPRIAGAVAHRAGRVGHLGRARRSLGRARRRGALDVSRVRAVRRRATTTRTSASGDTSTRASTRRSCMRGCRGCSARRMASGRSACRGPRRAVGSRCCSSDW